MGFWWPAYVQGSKRRRVFLNYNQLMKFKGLTDAKKMEVTKAVLLLRFRTEAPNEGTRKHLAYRRIGTILNLSANSVKYVCTRALQKAAAKKRPADLSRQLGSQHLDFLLSSETLKRSAGKSLAERSALFSQQFPGKRIAKTTLQRLYRQHKIKRKAVKITKCYKEKHLASYQKWKEIVLQKLKEVADGGLKLVWLDEVNFTKRSI